MLYYSCISIGIWDMQEDTKEFNIEFERFADYLLELVEKYADTEKE